MTVSCELCDSAILPGHRNRLGPSPFARADVYVSLCARLGVCTEPDDKPWELVNLPLCNDCHELGRKLGVELQELAELQRTIRKDLDALRKKIRQSVRANDETGQDHPFRKKVRRARFSQGEVEIPLPVGEEGQLVEMKEEQEPDENFGNNAEDIVNGKELEVTVPAIDPDSNGDVTEVYCDPLGLGNEDTNGSVDLPLNIHKRVREENENIPPTKRRKRKSTTPDHVGEFELSPGPITLRPEPPDVANLHNLPEVVMNRKRNFLIYCPSCRKKFKKIHQFQSHFRNAHKKELAHMCPLCQNFSQKQNQPLLYHIYNIHENRTPDEEKTLVCGKEGCGKRFLVQMTLDKHMEGHALEKLMPLQCSLCDTRFPLCGEELMERHKSAYHTTQRTNCVYPGCGRAFKRALYLRQHHHRDHPDMFTYIFCEFPNCSAKYSEEVHYQTHKQTHHTGEGPFPCGVCKTSFLNPSSLSMHLVCHTGEEGIPCPDCLVRVNTESEFLSHRVKEHGDEKQFKCGLCDHSFETEDQLTTHENKMHSPLPPRVCDLCDKVFRTPHLMRCHVDLVHRQQRKGSCPICGKMPDQGDLEGHFMLVHKGRRSYQCSTCGKKFSNGSILQNHEVIHRPLGSRLYSCDVCGMAFTKSNTMKTHMQKH